MTRLRNDHLVGSGNPLLQDFLPGRGYRGILCAGDYQRGSFDLPQMLPGIASPKRKHGAAIRPRIGTRNTRKIQLTQRWIVRMGEDMLGNNLCLGIQA